MVISREGIIMKCCEERWILKWWKKRLWATEYDVEKGSEKYIDKIGPKKKDSLDKTKRHNCVYELSRNVRCMRHL